MAATYLGIAFQPYVGQWTGTPPQATTPPWNSYSQQDIVRMLETIAPSFDKISTYGMGYAGYYPPTTPWNQVDSNCHIAGAAAQVNQQQGKVAIAVSQGHLSAADSGATTGGDRRRLCRGAGGQCGVCEHDHDVGIHQ